MYGWRARIGLIVPSSNTSMEEEFRKVLPEGVSLHTARMRLRNVTVEELFNMEKEAVEAASRLADADVDIIVYGCTSGSFVGGVGYDEEVVRRIKGAVNREVVATATAVVEGLKELNVLKIALVTPYIEEINRREKEFLEGNGFKVISVKGLGIVSNLEIGRQTPMTAYRLAKEAYTEEADGVFISCTNFRTLEILKPLETDLGRPVISSNQATFWATLRRLNIKEKVMGFGSLLEKHL